MKRGLSIISLMFLVSACAHLPPGAGESPGQLLDEACSIGRSNSTVTGDVWMRLESKEAKGQFPATIEARKPDQVQIEVTNLLGGREALIEVKQGKFSVDVPQKEGGTRHGEGEGSWGGIPLRWASRLFLGQIPCPIEIEESKIRLERNPDGDLIAETQFERFVYRFRSWAGKAWPESLHWERKEIQPKKKSFGAAAEAVGAVVDFKFDAPEDQTGSPKRWEAKSSKGEVKLRWREMRIVR